MSFPENSPYAPLEQISVKPYPHFYMRAHDIVVTATIACFPIFMAFATGGDGWSRREIVVIAATAAFVIALRWATLAIDANLRSRTRYELRGDAFFVYRSDQLISSFALENLAGLRPESVDRNGIGSVDLPRQPFKEGRGMNGWRSFVPALYADETISLVPGITQVCAAIRERSRLAGHAPNDFAVPLP